MARRRSRSEGDPYIHHGPWISRYYIFGREDDLEWPEHDDHYVHWRDAPIWQTVFNEKQDIRPAMWISVDS